MAQALIDDELSRWILEQDLLPAENLAVWRREAQASKRSLYALLKDEKVLPPPQLSLVARRLGELLLAPNIDPALLESAPPELDPEASVRLEIRPSSGSGAAARLGPYELLREIGSGGMGIVYEALHESTRRKVALKVLRPDAALTDGTLQRFVAEARMASNLPPHPHVVRVLDAGLTSDGAWLAMELVDGTSLRRLLDAGKVTPKAGARVLARVALALDHIHAHGIIHRDVKPSNILIDREGHAKLADFGIARRITAESRHTVSGELLGTFAYMSPEQAEDPRTVDHRADIYSLGATLYEVLAGRPPHVGERPLEVLASILDGRITPPHELDTASDPQLEAVALRALKASPEQRYASAAALAAALDAARYGELDLIPQAPRPPLPWSWPVVAACLFAAALVLGALALANLLSGDPKPPPPPATPSPPERPAEPTQGPVRGALELPEGWWTSPTLTLRGEVSPAEARVSVRLFRDAPRASLSFEAQAHDGAFSVTGPVTEGRWSVALHVAPSDAPWAQVAGGELRVDLSPPGIELAPLPAAVEQPQIVLEGQCFDAWLASLEVNGAPITLLPDGRFRHRIDLELGEQTLVLVARDARRQESEARVTITRRPLSAPVAVELQLSSPEEGALLATPSALLRGLVKPRHASLIVAGEPVSLDAEGRFLAPVTLDHGLNSILIETRDGERVSERSLALRCDIEPPSLTLTAPRETLLARAKVRLELGASEPLTLLDIPGAKLEWRDERRAAVGLLELEDGRHELRISARDEAGHTSALDIVLDIDTQPPELDWELKEDPKRSFAFELSGQARDPHLADLALAGEPLARDAEGRFTATLRRAQLEAGVILEARDALGHARRLRVTLASNLRLLQDREAWAAAGESRSSRSLQQAEAEAVGLALEADFELLGFERYERAGYSHRIAVFRHRLSGALFHLIPGGRARIGFDDADAHVALLRRLAPDKDDQAAGLARICQPAREVALPPFLIARRELSRGEWDAVVRVRPKAGAIRKTLPDHPLAERTRSEMKTWLAEAGLAFPSESEWEYACRAGTTGLCYWGEGTSDEDAWTRLNASTVQAVTAHAGRVNAFGLQDMIGNVSEACADAFRYDLKALPLDGSPVRSGEGKLRLIRGGSIASSFPGTSATRYGIEPDVSSKTIGLRPVRRIPLLEIIARLTSPP